MLGAVKVGKRADVFRSVHPNMTLAKLNTFDNDNTNRVQSIENLICLYIYSANNLDIYTLNTLILRFSPWGFLKVYSSTHPVFSYVIPNRLNYFTPLEDSVHFALLRF